MLMYKVWTENYFKKAGKVQRKTLKDLEKY